MRYITFLLLIGVFGTLYAQEPCSRCEVMPVLEKYSKGSENEFARHQLSKASLTQYLSATAAVPDGDYTIELLLDIEGKPSIVKYLLNGRPLEEAALQVLIQEKFAKFHVLNSWIPAEEELGLSPSKVIIAFDKKSRPCPDALYGLRQMILEGPCNQYFCSKNDLVEMLDYYDEDINGWNYIGEREKESLQWTITYPTKKEESISVIIDQVPTEEQWEQLKKKLPKKGKIEIERKMYGSETVYIAINLE